MTKSFGAMSIAELSALIQTGKVDPVEVTEDVLSAIDAYPDKAVFISLLQDRALAEARVSSKRLREGRSLGLLDGIPIAWKDLFDIQGTQTTAGSKVLRTGSPAIRDAVTVDLMRQAGTVAIGRTNMSEFAFSGIGINPHYGTPQNPRAQDAPRIPGGSSSGAGVAVAAGLVPVAMGTDTGGSVRIPAALNGIIGYKATRGRYAMEGVYPLAASLDSLGPLCRTVQDAAWIDAAMRGLPAHEIARAPVAPLDLVIPLNIVFDGAEAGVAAAFEQAVERLEKAGCRVERLPIPAFGEILRLMATRGGLVNAEAFALHRERLTGRLAADIDARVVARIKLGEQVTLPDYLAILEARRELIAQTESLIGERFLAFPTVAHVAPKISDLAGDDAFVAANGKTLRNTLLGNFLDWCGVSIPCGTGDADMPAGLLLSATANRDDALLRAAMAYEDIIRG